MKAYSNKYRVHRKTWLEIDEINEENFRMVQNKESVCPICVISSEICCV